MPLTALQTSSPTKGIILLSLEIRTSHQSLGLMDLENLIRKLHTDPGEW
jgi:hypothetical protein